MKADTIRNKLREYMPHQYAQQKSAERMGTHGRPLAPVREADNQKTAFEAALWRGGQENRTPFGVSRIGGLSNRGRNHATIPSDAAPHYDYRADQNNNNPEMSGLLLIRSTEMESRIDNPLISISPRKILSSHACGQVLELT